MPIFLSNLKHSNIVLFVHCCFYQFLCLVYVYCIVSPSCKHSLIQRSITICASRFVKLVFIFFQCFIWYQSANMSKPWQAIQCSFSLKHRKQRKINSNNSISWAIELFTIIQWSISVSKTNQWWKHHLIHLQKRVWLWNYVCLCCLFVIGLLCCVALRILFCFCTLVDCWLCCHH